MLTSVYVMIFIPRSYLNGGLDLYYSVCFTTIRVFSLREQYSNLTDRFCFHFATSAGSSLDGRKGEVSSACTSLPPQVPSFPIVTQFAGSICSRILTLPSQSTSAPGSGINVTVPASSTITSSGSTTVTNASIPTSNVGPIPTNPPMNPGSGETTTQSSSQTSGSSVTTGSTSSYSVTILTNLTSQSTSHPPVSSTNENSTSSATNSSQSKIIPIIGATVGSFVFLLLLLCALVYILHRRQQKRKYPAIFHRDMMVRQKRSESNLPLTPTVKDSDAYTNFGDAEKHTSYGSMDKEDIALSPKDYLEYSLPVPTAWLGNRSEILSPARAHANRGPPDGAT
ncbi:uncharacterized protein EV420DRAFT_970502 [Desarmillaria tabescens]|uniref:Mid2 domain-containing protein n=1 Tax=Armillaria tabescens TaxID=1929756 RepID=A0AA39MSB9_ARMTA|nr:uncharacterized protein EV420DRAFT_970502 [Desarmillaria tabescens]KAK0445291.1 hypothetical protein EV420DRAFT_970502 [Desarmillaria tabescens]